MEKVIVALWGSDQQALRSRLPEALKAAGACRIRLNLCDADVAAGAGLIQRWQNPQQDAVVQFWLPSANARFRAEIDAVLAAHSHCFAAWLVTESVIIANTAHPPQPGKRTWGWSQASFISFRPDMTREAAINVWHSHHTRVAIETQANFEYVQNLIVMPLTPDAPAYDAFVEECFPIAALSDPGAFYDAVGNEAKLKANLEVMMDSCGRFIDFARIDILPTSQFDA